jgi:5'-deoxynucleotidase YfbR-like HD superfamily hydrolase
MKLLLTPLLFVAVCVAQAVDDKTRHKEWMDRAQELKDDLRDALDAKAGQKAAKYADELSKTGAQEETYWRKAKQDEAVKLAKENLAASKYISAAAKIGNFDQALQAYSKLDATCRGCHDLHPEKRLIQRQ